MTVTSPDSHVARSPTEPEPHPLEDPGRPPEWVLLSGLSAVPADLSLRASGCPVHGAQEPYDLHRAVQGTLKSLLQQHSSKASILRRSAFFTVHLSHPYMTTGKTIALTRKKYMKYLFNTFGLFYIDLIFWIYWFKQYVLLKLVFLAPFYFLILATRKFKILYMAHIKYLWTGLDARVRLSIRKTSIKFLVFTTF